MKTLLRFWIYLVLSFSLWVFWFVAYAWTPPPGPDPTTLVASPPGPGPSADSCDPSDGWFRNQNLCAAPGVPTVESKTYTKSDFDSDASGGGRAALSWAKRAINRVLGLLALIALIVLIYEWVLMLVNARDSKKIEEGYTTVKNVAIALVFIGVSRLIVSFIFRAIGVFTW